MYGLEKKALSKNKENISELPLAIYLNKRARREWKMVPKADVEWKKKSSKQLNFTLKLLKIIPSYANEFPNVCNLIFSKNCDI